MTYCVYRRSGTSATEPTERVEIGNRSRKSPFREREQPFIELAVLELAVDEQPFECGELLLAEFGFDREYVIFAWLNL